METFITLHFKEKVARGYCEDVYTRAICIPVRYITQIVEEEEGRRIYYNEHQRVLVTETIDEILSAMKEVNDDDCELSLLRQISDSLKEIKAKI